MAKISLKKVKKLRLTMSPEEAKALYYSIRVSQVRTHAKADEGEEMTRYADDIETLLIEGLNESGVDF